MQMQWSACSCRSCLPSFIRLCQLFSIVLPEKHFDELTPCPGSWLTGYGVKAVEFHYRRDILGNVDEPLDRAYSIPRAADFTWHCLLLDEGKVRRQGKGVQKSAGDGTRGRVPDRLPGR